MALMYMLKCSLLAIAFSISIFLSFSFSIVAGYRPHHAIDRSTVHGQEDRPSYFRGLPPSLSMYHPFLEWDSAAHNAKISRLDDVSSSSFGLALTSSNI